MAETPYILANNLAAKATITGQINPDSKYKLARLCDGKRYTRWQSTDTVLKNLDFAIPAAYQRPVTCLILDRNHTLSGVQCRFLYSADGVTYTAVDTFTPASSAVVFRRFSGQMAHPYYRLELGASAELQRIPQIWFGQGWSLAYNPVAPFDPEETRFEYDDLETEAGVTLRNRKFEKRSFQLDLTDLPAAEYANIQTFCADIITYGGFLWFVFRPDSNPSDILYMLHKIKQRRFAQNQTGAYRDGSIPLEEVLGG